MKNKIVKKKADKGAERALENSIAVVGLSFISFLFLPRAPANP